MYERNVVAVDSIMPDFKLKDEMGNDLSLAEFKKGKKYIVLAFARGVDDRHTREELDYLKNDYERFRHLGGDVLVITTGSVSFNNDMITRLSLPFHLLSDEDCRVIKLLGICNQYDKLLGPAVYLLNQAGTVLFLYWGKTPSNMFQDEEVLLAMQGDTQSGPDWPQHW